MKIHKKSFLTALVAIVPWFLASVGALVHLSNILLFAVTMLLTAITFVLVLILHNKSTLTKIRPDSSKTSKFRESTRRIIGISIFSLYLFYVFTILWILIRFNFNLAYVRYFFFRGDNSLEIVFGGSKYLRMAFNYLLNPMLISYIICVQRWQAMEILILAIYCLSGMATGGRLALYETGILLIVATLFKQRYMGFDRRQILTLMCLFISAMYVHINRQINHLGISVYEAIQRSVILTFNYHSVQYGIISEATNAPVQYGPITGLLTPIYVLIGEKSPEGNLYAYLDNIQFHLNDSEYNAFGTSLMFFFPNFSWEGVILFFVCLWVLLILLILSYRNKLNRNLSKFMVFSIFFSGFQPYIFSFDWWLNIPLIIIFTCIFPRSLQTLSLEKECNAN